MNINRGLVLLIAVCLSALLVSSRLAPRATLNPAVLVGVCDCKIDFLGQQGQDISKCSTATPTCVPTNQDCITWVLTPLNDPKDGSCHNGNNCEAVAVPCSPQKIRFSITYSVLCPPTCCCPQDTAVVVSDSGWGSITRGGPVLQLDMGDFEIPCNTSGITHISTTCDDAAGEGVALQSLVRFWTCNNCSDG